MTSQKEFVLRMPSDEDLDKIWQDAERENTATSGAPSRDVEISDPLHFMQEPYAGEYHKPRLEIQL